MNSTQNTCLSSHLSYPFYITANNVKYVHNNYLNIYISSLIFWIIPMPPDTFLSARYWHSKDGRRDKYLSVDNILCTYQKSFVSTIIHDNIWLYSTRVNWPLACFCSFFFCNATTIPKVIQTMLSTMLFVITSVIILAKSKRWLKPKSSFTC